MYEQSMMRMRLGLTFLAVATLCAAVGCDDNASENTAPDSDLPECRVTDREQGPPEEWVTKTWNGPIGLDTMCKILQTDANDSPPAWSAVVSDYVIETGLPDVQGAICFQARWSDKYYHAIINAFKAHGAAKIL